MSRRKLVIAHALIAIQVLLAVGYYTWRDDHFDERFAWRMFSVNRLAQCQAQFRVGDPAKPVPMVREFHLAWNRIAQRGRREVLREMAAHLCRKSTERPITLMAGCTTLGRREPIAVGTSDLCMTGGP